MPFQTAVRKYVGIHEKKLKSLFFWLLPTDFSYQNRKKFGQKMRQIHNVLNFLRFQR